MSAAVAYSEAGFAPPPAFIEADVRQHRPRINKYMLHAPHPQQRAALLINRRELLFGGAGGGGKSDYLLMAALQYVDQPDYGAIIFRRTYPQLKLRRGLIPRAMEWLEGTDAQGAEKDGGYPTRWDFPSGAQLSFGHMQHFKDHSGQQGGEYEFVGIDEAGQFIDKMLTYMFSRLRRLAGSKIPTRLRATANPGGPGHEFIMERYGIPAEVVSSLIAHPSGRIFIPSKLADNPSIDRADYLKNLAHLDPVTRAQIEFGDWSAREAGDMFDRAWFEILDEAPHAERKIRYWDLAGTASKPGTDPDWTVGTLMSMSGTGSDRSWAIEDVDRFRKRPSETRQRVIQAAHLDGHDVVVGLEQEPGSSGKDVVDRYREDLAGFELHIDRPTGAKSVRAGPMASSAQVGKVKVVRGPWLSHWLSEFDAFPGGGHDDQVDSASGAYMYLAQEPSFVGLI